MAKQKKGKGKSDNKQKNKKGKGQDAPDNQTPPPAPASQEPEEQKQEQPRESDAEPETQVNSPSSETAPATGSAPEPTQEPEVVPEPDLQQGHSLPEEHLQPEEQVQPEEQLQQQSEEQLQFEGQSQTQEQHQSEDQMQPDDQLQAEQIQPAEQLPLDEQLQSQDQIQPAEQLPSDEQFQPEQQLQPAEQLQPEQFQREEQFQPEGQFQPEEQFQAVEQLLSEQPPQPVAENTPPAVDTEQPDHSWADADHSVPLDHSEMSMDQQQDADDVQLDFTTPRESHFKEFDNNPFVNGTEPSNGDHTYHDTNGGPLEPSEQVPVTAPQTPTCLQEPASGALPSPSETERQFIPTSPRSNTGPLEVDTHAANMPNPFVSSAVASPAPHASSPVHQTTPPASKPATPVPEATSAAPESISPSVKPASTNVQVAPTPPITSPISRHASPAPQPVSSSSRASPMAQPASPLSEAAGPVQKPASPAPPPYSTNHAPSPVLHSPSPKTASPVRKSSSSAAKTASPGQRRASPVPKSASPLPKASSPLARPYMSPMMASHVTQMQHPMASMPPPTAPVSMAPSYAAAYQSPVMSSAGFLPQYPYYHPSPTMHHAAAQPTPNTASFQALRDLGFGGAPGINGKGTMSPPEHHDEPIELLQRIQDAIPDISRLMGSYRNTKSKLHNREIEFKQMETQHEQTIMSKDFYIEALQSQMRKAANESAEETRNLKNSINELRMELGNLDEKWKDLKERFEDSEQANVELSHSKSELETQVRNLNHELEETRENHAKELEQRKEEQEQALATQKQELTEFFEEIKAEDEKAAAEALAAREKELLDDQEAMKADYEKQKEEMQASRDALQSEFDSTVADLNTTKTQLEDKHNELEETKVQHAKEVADMQQSHAEEVESLKANHAEEVESLKASHAEEVAGLEKQISERLEQIAKLEEEGALKERQLQGATEGMRLTIDNLGNDCDRLRKTLTSLGEATDLKSTKGDSFFVDCFDQLSQQIVSLSEEYFAYLPIAPPKDILDKLPSELPSFLDNTRASRELRSAYVQHVLSKTLTYRIFQPFLFTLGRRYDKADTFFQMLSMDIRRKSVRRETFWRQQTLKAAYTTSDAKESINVAAAVIVDEIVGQLKPFVDPTHLDALLTAVRRIVKLAAETWRLARVERELILASLPSPNADAVSNDAWEEHGTPKEGCVGSKEDPTRHVILRTFPRIVREAAHEDFAEDEERESPCTYAAGRVLFSDSPVVMARRQELAQRSSEGLNGGEDMSRKGSRDTIQSRRGRGSPDSLRIETYN